MNPELKARAVAEFKLYWIFTAYLFVTLGSFILYRRLILADAGVPYLNYGIAVIESMVIAKVILIGHALKIGTRYESRPLAVSVAYKTALFGLVVIAFGLVERIVKGLLHYHSLLEALRHVGDAGIYELLGRVLIMTICFVPMFAFWELSRTIGGERLKSLFLSARDSETATAG
jgi:hypothetical protein